MYRRGREAQRVAAPRPASLCRWVQGFLPLLFVFDFGELGIDDVGFVLLRFAARLGAVRGSTAEGFELDIITMVLLGGVSIFGGSGTLVGVGLSILLVLNLRNGMSLVNITSNTQTGVIGALLILSVLIPNWTQDARSLLSRRRRTGHTPVTGEEKGG